jgi:glycosyltransferase involved in cell wall biosynthesis
VRTVSDFDAVYVYREAALLGPALLERYIARRGVPFVYELDDPLHIPYDSPVNGAFARLKFVGKVPHLCRLADAVVTNSRPLERYAAAFNGNVWRIPSLIDERRYQPTMHAREDGPVCIGWTGSRSTMSNLSVIAPVLRRIQAERSVEIRVVGAGTPDLAGVDVHATDWAEATEVEDLRAFDIGLAPLPAAPWNDWKFFSKIAQYMALGLPSVASAVGAVADQIDHGVNGFIARDLDDWYTHLSALVTDAALRRRLGNAAAEKARSQYTVEANADQIRSVFESLPARHRSSAR